VVGPAGSHAGRAALVVEGGAGLGVGGVGGLVGGPRGGSGYNGNTNAFGSLSPGTAVQVNHPQGLALGPNGDVLFADTANKLMGAAQPGLALRAHP
jgi:hypothetical protein